MNNKFSLFVIDIDSQQLGGNFVKTYIRENGDLYKAQAAGKFIFDYQRPHRHSFLYYLLGGLNAAGDCARGLSAIFRRQADQKSP